ncbi:MAG: AAC(3) family N-acetyltransferase [Atribacterota bacterium]|nr:AAC(3) family N-acetyltransferase [Atribacterota bacterium]
MAGFEYLLSRYWIIEVACRRFARIFSSNQKVKFFLKKIMTKILKKHNQNNFSVIPGLAEGVFTYISSLGIKKGDILIVHSSMDGLARLGIPPNKIIDLLLDMVGSEGTLVFPAFPIINKRMSNTIQIYNPKSTVSWTGMLPNIFCRYNGVIRSPFPYNSLAAKGFHAENMMKNNLLTDLPHGKNSAWEYCINHNAKILYLGIHAESAFTIVHAVEDLMDEEWPVNNWYKYANYKVKLSNELYNVTIRHVNTSHWFQFVRKYYALYVLQKNGFVIKNNIQGIPIDYIPESLDLVNYLMNNAKSGNIVYYAIPKKYLK